MASAGTIYTIGHSTHSSEVFFGFLEWHGIKTLADVRALPGSRRNPQFGRDGMMLSCQARDMTYHWMPALGGRRRSPRVMDARHDSAPTSRRRKKDEPSRHVAWEVPAFRAYADYMDTPEFAAALAELEREATAAPTAFCCAEALWWQCHRRLIADRLTVQGWTVLHIDSGGHTKQHALPDFARVEGGRLVYDVGVTLELPT